MGTNDQDLNNNLLTQDGRPINTATILEWLQADQVAASLLQGYLAARKLGVECPQGRKNGDFSGIALNAKE